MAQREDRPKLTREECIFMVKIAEQAERYREMADFMQLAIAHHPVLDNEERNLFSVAFKNLVGIHRASWRILSSIEQKAKSKDDPHLHLLTAYRSSVESDLKNVCEEILQVLEILVRRASPQDFVFYHKMRGDYYRYMLEYATGDARKRLGELLLDAYHAAISRIWTDLPPCDPTRLGMILIFSNFLYDVAGQRSQACGLAKRGFDEAIADLDSLTDDQYRSVTPIMQSLRDNLTLWTQEALIRLTASDAREVQLDQASGKD